MADTAFDTALIAAFLRLAGEQGWHRANVAAAARSADLSLAEARARFPSRAAVLKAFARMADQAALEGATTDGSVKDRLFDLMMRRFDALQAHRAGVVAVARGVVFEPPMLILMACLTRRSMRWMLQAAGVSTAGPLGELRIKGLMAVWLWTLRAWERDTSDDLSATMAALDNALTRADQMAGWLSRRDRDDAGVEPDVDLTLGGDTPEQA
jgi:ubiquinone biosynthesis protein COQ9